jgi:hypothetical protein
MLSLSRALIAVLIIAAAALLSGVSFWASTVCLLTVIALLLLDIGGSVELLARAKRRELAETAAAQKRQEEIRLQAKREAPIAAEDDWQKQVVTASTRPARSR